MTRQLAYGTVRDHPRKVIHVLRILDDVLDYPEIDGVAERMRGHVASRFGEQILNVVIVQSDSKETLRTSRDVRHESAIGGLSEVMRTSG
jgi:hypothetical protein